MFECVPNAYSGDTNVIIQTIAQLKSSQQNQIGAVGELKNQGALFYHFDNLADATNWLKAKYGAKSSTVPTNNKCGYTGLDLGVGGIGHNLVTSIFQFCHYTLPTNLGTRDVTNPSLQETTAHEAGHSFDFALSLDSSVKTISTAQSLAYKNLVVADLDYQIDTVPTCALFGTVPTSMLELNLGADALSSVCNQSNVVNAPYNKMTNLQILKLKAPYFFFPSTASTDYRELWAQQFARQTQNTNQGPAVLPITDYVVNAMNGYSMCSEYAVEWWKDWLTVPASGGEYPNYCTIYPNSDWNR